MINYVTFNVLQRSTNICAQRAPDVCTKTRLICKKNGVKYFASRPFQHVLITNFRLTPCALPCAPYVAHVALHFMFFLWPNPIQFSLSSKRTLPNTLPHTGLTVSQFEGYLVSVLIPLRTTAAGLLPELLPLAIHCKIYLPNESFLFPLSSRRSSSTARVPGDPRAELFWRLSAVRAFSV